MTARFWMIAALLIALAAPAHAENKSGIAVIVNDQPITVGDINDRLQLYTANAPTPPPEEVRQQIARQVLSKLIDEKLQLQEAAKTGINITEAQVNEAFASVAQNNQSTADEFKARMIARGVKPQTLMDQLRAEVAWGQLVRRKLRPQINITESEIDSEFDKMAAAHATFPAPQPAEAPAAVDPTVAAQAPGIAPDKTNDVQREQVATQLGMDRLNKLAERYLRDLRATAFIDDKRG